MKTEIPLFDPKVAKPVEPTRHEPTGRTFSFVQGAHLFSATGLYIATETAPTPKPAAR